MRFIDFFSGIGGFRLGMEMAGHTPVGHCEINKYAEMSYRAMHTITAEQREYLQTLPLQQRQMEILEDKYLNGEYYTTDIHRIEPRDLPDADCYTFGFPCQSFSLAGLRGGLEDIRGTLFLRSCGWLKSDSLNYYLVRTSRDYSTIKEGKLLEDLSELWMTWGMMQSGKCLTARILEYHKTGSECTLLDILEDQVDSRYFLSPERTATLLVDDDTRDGIKIVNKTSQGYIEGKVGGALNIARAGSYSIRGRVIDDGDTSPTIDTTNQVGVIVAGGLGEKKSHNSTQWYQQDRIYDTNGVSPALNNLTGGNLEPKIVEPNGGVKIRKLTPKECFRLQGMPDDYFERAALVNNDTQLYKQAGNSVTVNVVYEIARRLT